MIDSDNDLQNIFLDFSDSAENWLEWDEATLTIRTKDLDLQTLGTFVVNLRPMDTKGQFNTYPILIEVSCTPGNVLGLCAPEAESGGFTTTDGTIFGDDDNFTDATSVGSTS